MDVYGNFSDTSSSTSTGINFLSYFLIISTAFNFFIKYILPILILIYFMIINHRIKNINKLLSELLLSKTNEKKDF